MQKNYEQLELKLIWFSEDIVTSSNVGSSRDVEVDVSGKWGEYDDPFTN